MDRRRFLGVLGAGVAGLAVNEVSFAQESSGAMPEVAFTFDDPQLVDYPGASGSSWADVDFMLRRALRQAGVKATLFVCGMRVDNAEGKKLLQAWNDDGHVLANHSYSHLYFHSDKVTLAQFEGDALKGENVVSGYPRFQKIFRYPFFKEGDTIEKRDGMRWWLAQRGYKMGRATIDASDWAIDGRMRKRLEKGPKADLAGYRDFYLQHIWERSHYYYSLAKKVWGRPVRHTVLLHHRLLSALFLQDLIAMYRASGWKVVDAEYAYQDAIYKEQPKILPAGESLVWALAREKGMSGLRYPGEDDTYENAEMDRRGL
jgi:peptidoglycan/xylan/chitin deacetylase (PgdA/CDA1 family)